jgi:pimeloyl-ACP methyl ester carboxylesterase
MTRTITTCVPARIVLALVVAFAVPAASAAVAQSPCPRELWVISTRAMPYCGAEVDPASFDYRRVDDCRQCVPADEAEFLASAAPGVPTVFFIHGSWIDRCMAIQEGWSLYHAIQAAACDRPFRLVVWSWPSERIQGGLRHDAQVKAARSDVQAHYLALCLDRMSPDVPVNLVGHSFGARTILGAMELLAGGTVAGRVTTHDANRPRGPIRAVLIAAAVENGCLLPGRRDGLALGQLERVLITCNVNDSALKWYPRLYGRGGPEALGYTGPACPSRLGDQREKIETLNLTCSVGSHDWTDYLRSSALRLRLGSYTFVSAVPESEAAAK